MSAADSLDGAPRLVDLLIEEQQTLRAVDEFSEFHAQREGDEGRFETLIPMDLPGTDQQFAFAVDLDACTGCKACVTACHSLNGLELGETWRKVGEIEGSQTPLEIASVPVQQTVTTACHHCESPACLAGCPVRAYEKDPITGIVVHLDDQCIGCRYCQLTCPYDVPQFSERLGIVRKCDMCHGRLAAGEAPACVQGCPNEAISIEIVDRSTPVDQAMMLPLLEGGMPRSSLTRPTTRYRSERALPTDLRAVDSGRLAPSDAHTPLAVMLVLTQAGIGTVSFDLALGAAFPGLYGPVERLATLAAATVVTLIGLAASIHHLGRPQYAFRAFLGLLTSWMSREIIALGAFAGALVAALLSSMAESGWPTIELAPWSMLAQGAAPARLAACLSGLLGLFCSIKIYAVTGRPFWRLDRTALRFVGTALVLGASVSSAAWTVAQAFSVNADASAARLSVLLPLMVGLPMLVKLGLERGVLLHGEVGHDDAALARTRRLFDEALRPLVRRRTILAVAFGVGVPLGQAGLAAWSPGGPATMAAGILCLVGCLAGECVERSLFFQGEAMRGMPGAH